MINIRTTEVESGLYVQSYRQEEAWTSIIVGYQYQTLIIVGRVGSRGSGSEAMV